ncbi:hypothetical protein SPI_05304 [Niveomyces insectorum RCEF 264]|uniref:Uncharacterized protein n=1 Tax=Niveomyces insectorum RCEF 264 TaxID=1081102 RepID=A0A167U696_9HYPO|nr:hypothetical protein SPI_05304 [Niveomyces insectorum RCEF 264]
MPLSVVVRDGSYNDRSNRATPTASTFALRRGSNDDRAGHGNNETTTTATNTDNAAGYSFADYDEGDIFDALLEDLPTPVPRPPAVPVADGVGPTGADTDAASADSSTSSAAAETELDARSSLSSARSRTHPSDTSATSATSATSVSGVSENDLPRYKPDDAVRAALNNARRRQRRPRRRNHRRGAPSVTSSDAGYTAAPRLARTKLFHGPAPSKGAKAPATTTAKATSAAAPATTATEKTASPTKRRRRRRACAPRLQIGVDLDVELQLKAKVRGDICLTLVLEETEKMAPRPSPEIRRNAAGNFVAYDDWEDDDEDEDEDEDEDKDDGVEEIVEATKVDRIEVRSGLAAAGRRPDRREICHLRVGRLNLNRRWWVPGYEALSQIPPPVVAGLALTMPVVGFAAGMVAAQWMGWR